MGWLMGLEPTTPGITIPSISDDSTRLSLTIYNYSGASITGRSGHVVRILGSGLRWEQRAAKGTRHDLRLG